MEHDEEASDQSVPQKLELPTLSSGGVVSSSLSVSSGDGRESVSSVMSVLSVTVLSVSAVSAVLSPLSTPEEARHPV